jgi:hypothetical protein
MKVSIVYAVGFFDETIPSFLILGPFSVVVFLSDHPHPDFAL